MLALVEQLKGFILDGQVVYMHCWGGRGRAGTIASCFLASCYHLTAQETADRVQLAFDTRNDAGMLWTSHAVTETCIRKWAVQVFCGGQGDGLMVPWQAVRGGFWEVHLAFS